MRTPSATAIAGEGDHPEGVVEGAQASMLHKRCRRALTLSLLVTFEEQGKQRRRCKPSAPTTKVRILRPLHHGSLATRAPVVPLPRFAGAESEAALATHRILVHEATRRGWPGQARP